MKESITQKEYGVIRDGGSVGETKGRVLYVYDNMEEAKNKARQLNKSLTRGEKQYYKIKYRAVVIKLSLVLEDKSQDEQDEEVDEEASVEVSLRLSDLSEDMRHQITELITEMRPDLEDEEPINVAIGTIFSYKKFEKA